MRSVLLLGSGLGLRLEVEIDFASGFFGCSDQPYFRFRRLES